jgi:hypothetical protein
MPSDLIERGAKVVIFDRETPGELARALSSGADALIDTIAFHPDHARQLIEVQDNVSTFVVISSSSVYQWFSGPTRAHFRDAANGRSREAKILLASPGPPHQSSRIATSRSRSASGARNSFAASSRQGAAPKRQRPRGHPRARLPIGGPEIGAATKL